MPHVGHLAMLLCHRAGVITEPPQSDHKGRFTCRAYAYNLDKVSVHLAAPIGGPKELRRILNGQGNLHAPNHLFSLVRSHFDDKDGRVITRPPLIQCQSRFQNAIGDLLGPVTPYSGFIKRWATFIPNSPHLLHPSLRRCGAPHSRYRP